MTDEQRERATGWIESEIRWREEYGFKEDNYLGVLKTFRSILEQQPTEEEAKEAWNVLQRGLSRCESMNEKACARCSKFKGCQEGEETIRKALGIEEG